MHKSKFFRKMMLAMLLTMALASSASADLIDSGVLFQNVNSSSPTAAFTITPFDTTKTMGRFFTRRGPSLYMCFAEADDLPALRARLRDHAPADWTGPPDGPLDTLFIHPKALGGVMMGVSRTTFGWTWSGRPERVVAALGGA